MMTRREALAALGALTTLGRSEAFLSSVVPTRQGDAPPPLAPGAPNSPERLALIERFMQSADGLDTLYEAHSFKSDWSMPYRLFRSKAPGALPLVVFLHGSGGLGDDNEKQMGLGNIFGTRLFALPANQKRFPCFVVAPQTDRGWARYGPPADGDSVARPIAGLGDGARVAMELIDQLVKDLPIDTHRIYLTGQSMGGGGVWNMITHRPRFFAAAAPCCGSATNETPVAGTPLWNFHGDADQTVPIAVSRGRIATLRKLGVHPYQTEYPGVGHNSWEWAYTEPAMLSWMFKQRRG